MHSHLLPTPPNIGPVSATLPEEELRTLRLPDARLTRRVKKIYLQLEAQPGASLPKATGDWAGAKGAYRLFDNPQVEAEAMQAAHRDATLARAAQAPRLLLAPQDTTTLNLSDHSETAGLGPIGNNADKTMGYFLHSTLLVGEQGPALGVLDTQVYARDPRDFKGGPKGRRNRQPVEDKESYRWLESITATVRAAVVLPETVLVNLGDREADSYEGFWHHQQLRAGAVRLGPEPMDLALVQAAAARVELLFRCQHNRVLKTKQTTSAETADDGEDGAERLFAQLARQPVAGTLTVAVPRQPGQPQRLAVLTLRHARVTLPPPAHQAKDQGYTTPLVVWAVLAEELHPPARVARISWRLLSTLPVEDFATAVTMVQRYTRRWAMEEFHRILKSGCKAESRQLEKLERLKRVLALDIIVAIRVLILRDVARDPVAGASPATAWLTEPEWQALWCAHHRQSTPPKQPPTVTQAVRWIAQLGGFLARKSDGYPGAMTLWTGLQRLADLSWAFALASARKDVGNA